MKKYDYIDALRGWAILGVISLHNIQGNTFKDYSAYPEWFYKLAGAGGIGVDLFFILSSLTLCLSSDNRQSLEKNFILNFYIRRFFRIAPLFYLCIILYPLIEQREISLRYYISNFTFIFGFHPIGFWSVVPYGWSIGVEVMFYAIFPLIFMYIKNPKRALIGCVLAVLFYKIAACVILNENFSHTFNQESLRVFLDLSLVAKLPVFLLGVILFFLIKEKNINIEFDRKNNGILFVICSLFFLEIILGNIFSRVFQMSVALFFIAYLLSIKPYKIFVNAVTIEIGKLSFSMYLFHNLSFQIAKYLSCDRLIGDPIINCLIRYCIVLIMTYILSKISYELIEKNGIKAGKLLINKLEKRQTA